MGIIFPGIPPTLAERLNSKNSIIQFIETGTYKGGTARWAAKHFEKVITIEASEEIYKSAHAILAPFPNISHLLGTSQEHLPHLSNAVTTLFWLDAHHCGGDTFKGANPLLQELDIINQRWKDPYILIDDARVITASFLGNRYCSLPDLIRTLERPDRYISIFDDVVIAVPLHAKPLVDDYTNERSKIYWADFKKRIKPTLKRRIKGYLKSIGI